MQRTTSAATQSETPTTHFSSTASLTQPSSYQPVVSNSIQFPSRTGLSREGVAWDQCDTSVSHLLPDRMSQVLCRLLEIRCSRLLVLEILQSKLELPLGTHARVTNHMRRHGFCFVTCSHHVKHRLKQTSKSYFLRPTTSGNERKKTISVQQ
jgi:hypothetical protein